MEEHNRSKEAASIVPSGVRRRMSGMARLAVCVACCISMMLQTAAYVSPVMAADGQASVTFQQLNDPAVFLKQSQSRVCTLTASAMMVRRTAMLMGNEGWRQITEQSIRKDAWAEGTGLKWNFTTYGITVAHKTLSSTNELISLLDEHPEGIVIYNSRKPHAVLATDYTDGIFYCSDPSNDMPTGRYPMAQASITAESASRCWYVKQPVVTVVKDHVQDSGAGSNAAGNGDAGQSGDRTDIGQADPLDPNVTSGQNGTGAEPDQSILDGSENDASNKDTGNNIDDKDAPDMDVNNGDSDDEDSVNEESDDETITSESSQDQDKDINKDQDKNQDKNQDQSADKQDSEKNEDESSKEYTVDGMTYRIINAQEHTAACTGLASSGKSAAVPGTVMIDETEYQVVQIANRAFANSSKLKTVTIGANVSTIGTKAFYKCKKLKTVTINAKNLQKIGTNAFAYIHKKAKIYVLSEQIEGFGKLLTGTAVPGTVTIGVNQASAKGSKAHGQYRGRLL